MFHGTSLDNARNIQSAGFLSSGQYVTDDFELAASYALRHGAPAVIVVEGAVGLPDEIAYDSIEFVAAENLKVVEVLQPTFAGKPLDWYDLDDGLNRRYPHLFELENWK